MRRQLLTRLSLLGALFASYAHAQNATCQSGFSWMDNGDDLDPCALAGELGQICTPGFTVPPLSSLANTYFFSNPSHCACSLLFYNLVAACTDCQGGENWSSFSEYITNCSTAYVGGDYAGFPQSIPSNIDIPDWALVDFSNGRWNEMTAYEAYQADPDKDRSNIQNDDSGEGSSTPIGAIVGGVVGGVAVIAIIVTAFICIRRRKNRRKAEQAGAAALDQHDGSGSSTEDKTPYVPPTTAGAMSHSDHNSSYNTAPNMYQNHQGPTSGSEYAVGPQLNYYNNDGSSAAGPYGGQPMSPGADSAQAYYGGAGGAMPPGPQSMYTPTEAGAMYNENQTYGGGPASSPYPPVSSPPPQHQQQQQYQSNGEFSPMEESPYGGTTPHSGGGAGSPYPPVQSPPPQSVVSGGAESGGAPTQASLSNNNNPDPRSSLYYGTQPQQGAPMHGQFRGHAEVVDEGTGHH